MDELSIPEMPDDLIHPVEFQHVFEEECQAATLLSFPQEPMVLLVQALQRYAATHSRLRGTCLLFRAMPKWSIVVVYDIRSNLQFVAPQWLAQRYTTAMASAKTSILVEGEFTEAERVLYDGQSYRVLETLLLRPPEVAEDDETGSRPYGYLELVQEE